MSPFTMEKMAVLAPMESASVRTTVKVKPGLSRSCRTADLRFWRKMPMDAPAFRVQWPYWACNSYELIQELFRIMGRHPGCQSSLGPRLEKRVFRSADEDLPPPAVSAPEHGCSRMNSGVPLLGILG